MRAVWVRARSDLRSHWRALVAMCLLAGLSGAVAVAAAIGASRTDSVSSRVIQKEDPTDIFYVPDYQDTKLRFADIAALPVVSAAYEIRGFPVATPALQDLEVSAPHGGPLPSRFFKMLDGRAPDPRRADEVMISFRTRDRYHWRVGSRVSFALADPSSDPSSGDVKPGPVVSVRVVGINAASGDLVGVAGPGMMTSPAFEREYTSKAATLELQTFKLRRGQADLGAFEAGARKLAGGKLIQYTEIQSDLGQVRRSFHLQAVALWITCIVVSAVSLLIFGQSIARQVTIEADEYPALRSLGMTRRDLTWLGLVRALIVAGVAAAIALCAGILLSIATPFGLARVIEPNPGPWIPAYILVTGCGALVVAVMACAVFPSWRAASVVHRESSSSSSARPTLASRVLGLVTGKPSPALGARFALEQGRGRATVPVRSSLTAAVVGVVVLLAALSVGMSVKHFAATPRLYGWTWDVAYDSGHAVSFEPGSKARDELVSDPSISDVSVGGIAGATFRLNGVGMDGIALDPVKGHLEPNILEGRSPAGLDEVAVGRKSLQQARAHVGSTVTVGLVGKNMTIPMHVVGVAVFPFDDDTSTIGEGLWMSAEALNRIAPEAKRDSAAIRFAPGASKRAELERLKGQFAGDFTEAQTPGGVTDYRRVSQVPLVLAGLLAALAVGTLAHLLVSSIHRRRRDLAILKALGFEKRQARGVVLWQAGVFTAVVLVIAAPLGWVVGRLAWNVIATYGGFDPAPVIPLGQFGITCGAALVVALAISLAPARVAARTPVAAVLRTE